MPRTKKDVVTEFRTAAILQAAHRVFAEQGFEHSTMAEIARVAGVAKGTIYLYYPSKQDIYLATLRSSAADLAGRTRAAMDHALTVGEKIRAFIETRLRYFEEHRDFFRIYDSAFGRAACLKGPHGRHLEDLHLEQVKALDQVLQQAARRKAIRPIRTEAAACAILDITRSVVTQRLRGSSRASLDEDIAFAVDLTWKGIGHR
jgi:AcrR family transcriptional regulator